MQEIHAATQRSYAILELVKTRTHSDAFRSLESDLPSSQRRSDMKGIHQAVLTACVAACSTGMDNAVAGGDQSTLDEVLTKRDGMTQISEGLYARADEYGESYVAIGKPAQEALASKLMELNRRFTGLSDGSASSRGNVSDTFSSAIADLTQPAAKNDSETGDCSGPGGTDQPQLYAQASSTAGLTASAYAVLTSDFGPITWTVNFASALTENRLGITTSSQTSTQNADTPASASAAAPNSNQACVASSYASVKCPGQSVPAISAAAYTLKMGCSPP